MFYSRFESGNLLKAIEVPVDLPNNPIVPVSCDLINLAIVAEYNLYLEQDTTTNGHMNWYYFKTISKGLPPGTRIRIHIRNFV